MADNRAVMSMRWLLAPVAALGLLVAPPASAAAPGLAISVPTGPVSLGTRTIGSGSFSASLGAVTVTTGISVLGSNSWVAKVTSTDFTTGGGGTGRVVPASALTYTGGAATASSGIAANVCVPSLTAQALSTTTPVAAYSCTGLSLVTGTSLSWNPTITVTPPAGVIAGAYSGTITHSVA